VPHLSTPIVAAKLTAGDCLCLVPEQTPGTYGLDDDLVAWEQRHPLAAVGCQAIDSSGMEKP
jgi:hypothetical protein